MYILYALCMDVSITQFRRDLFELVNQAMKGTEVCVVHRGKRFKIQPLDAPPDRLSRITSLPIAEPARPTDPNDQRGSLLHEMEKSWERDWESL